MEFLAKSFKKGSKRCGDTLVEHTNELVNQLKLLVSLYKLPVNVQELSYVCRLHDLGKINSKFQKKIAEANKGKQVFMEEDEIPHPVFSASMVDHNVLIDNDEFKAVEAAVLYHHGLRNLYTVSYSNLSKQIAELPIKIFDFSKVNLIQPSLSVPTLSLKKLPSYREPWYEQYIILLGLLHRLDYAASGHYAVEEPPENVVSHINKYFVSNGYSYNDMQLFLKRNRDKNVILSAQTGMGKTEGALNWINDKKGFLVLPIRTAINEQYKRILNNYVDTPKGVGILHSTARGVLKNNDVDQEYYKEYRNLSSPLTVSTADQVLKFSIHSYGWETVLATLAYSHVVIDEIQAYDPSILGYILSSIKDIQKAGGKTLIMSGTIYPFVKDTMMSMGIEGVTSKDYIDEKLNSRHSIKIHRSSLKVSSFVKDVKDKKTLVIVNTVKKAQELYRKLPCGVEAHLLTSKFILKDRERLEKEIMNCTGPSLWICTQVVEASLDIDFDVLYTEMGDLASLFQRMGRVYRRRNYLGNGYNVHVFVGSDHTDKYGVPIRNYTLSGYGTVYNKAMVDLGIEAIKYLKGILTEQRKYALMDKFYTTQKLRNSRGGNEYLDQVKDAISFIANSKDEEYTKQEAAKKFRSVDTYTCIPLPVYKENKKKIDLLVSKYKDNPIDCDTQIREYCVELYKDSVKGAYDYLEYGYHKVFLPDVGYDKTIGVF